MLYPCISSIIIISGVVLTVLNIKAARITTGSNSRINTDAMFSESGLMNLKDINVYLLEKVSGVFEGFFVYKVSHKTVDPYYLA